MPTYIKVCGLTQEENTRMVVAAGVDAVGLNFFPRSKRFVDLETAKRLRDCIPPEVDVVGVFVNSPPDEVVNTATEVGLNVVQFHGDESATEIASAAKQLPHCRIFRAFRLNEALLANAVQTLADLESAGVRPEHVLVDAFVSGEYGGTGHRLDHELLLRLPGNWPPVIVAGGLNPDNVAACVKTVRPFGVDVASGVEEAPGLKSESATRAFVQSVRSAE